METLTHTQPASVEHQVWLRAFLRALDSCTPDDAKDLAQRAVDIYQERWRELAPIDPKEHRDRAEYRINQQIAEYRRRLDEVDADDDDGNP